MDVVITKENIEKRLFTQLISRGYVPSPKELHDFSGAVFDTFMEIVNQQVRYVDDEDDSFFY